MNKLFVSDLDGTLLNAFHSTDFIIFRGIKKLFKRGDSFAIATGRNMRKEHIEHDFKDIKVYCIAMNGALILNPLKEIIYEARIDRSIIENVLTNFPEIKFEFITRSSVLVNFDKKTAEGQLDEANFFTKLLFKRFKELYMSEYRYDISNEEILNNDILKFNCKISNPEVKERFDKYLLDNKDKLVNAAFDKRSYEITAAGVNKGVAIKKLAEILKVKNNDIYVYGDGDNDVKMLEMYENSYAPSNACENAKNAARYTLADNKTYSVIRHMLKQ